MSGNCSLCGLFIILNVLYYGNLFDFFIENWGISKSNQRIGERVSSRLTYECCCPKYEGEITRNTGIIKSTIILFASKYI